MKNPRFKTQQNAIVKRTLSLEEFLMDYIVPSKIQMSDLKTVSINNQ
ncbi:hypothetical protein [Mariniflexile sp.]